VKGDNSMGERRPPPYISELWLWLLELLTEYRYVHRRDLLGRCSHRNGWAIRRKWNVIGHLVVYGSNGS